MSQRQTATTVEEDVAHLAGVLTPLTELFQKLYKLLEKEKRALEQRKPDLLESLALEIGQVLEEVQVADTLRQRLTRQLGAKLGLSGERLNLKALDQALGGDSGLMAFREQLQRDIEKADTANRRNQAIFSGVLAATESMLRALKEGTQGPAASYDRKGYRHLSGAGFHFISKQL